MTADAKLAAVIYLKDQPFAAEFDQRIYYDGETLEEEIGQMAQKAILIIRSGGPEDAGYADAHYERFDIKCYGATLRQAWRVYMDMQVVLKAFVPQNIPTVDGDVRLYNFIRSGGPNELRDPDGGWPFVWSSWLVKSSAFQSVLVS